MTTDRLELLLAAGLVLFSSGLVCINEATETHAAQDRKIHGAIYRVVGPDEDARDLCQEAFLKAYRGAPHAG